MITKTIMQRGKWNMKLWRLETAPGCHWQPAVLTLFADETQLDREDAKQLLTYLSDAAENHRAVIIKVVKR